MRFNPRLARRITLRDLHYLMAVVQTGSMAKAADLLSVSQPVVSKVIANIEYLLGEQVLDRSSRGVEPTVYGKRLLDSSFAIFDELRQGIVEVERLLGASPGELSIGSNEASTLGIVPDAIKRMRCKNDQASIRVVLVNIPSEQRQELLRRTVELCIGRVWPHLHGSEFETELLFQEQYAIVAGPNSPFHGKGHVELGELADEEWIFPPAHHLSGQLITEIFRSKGLRIPVGRVRTSSMQLVQRLLAQDRLLAMLPTTVLPVLTLFSPSRVLPVPLPDLALPIGILKLKNRRLGATAESFIEAARLAARSMPNMTAESISP